MLMKSFLKVLEYPGKENLRPKNPGMKKQTRIKFNYI